LQSIEAEIGGSTVLSSGVFVVADTQPLKLYPFGRVGPYYLEFRFKNEGTDRPRIKNYSEGTGHIVELIDVGRTPTTVTLPLYVANKGGRRVLLQFAVEEVGAAPVTRTIACTFFDGGPIA
jgi:hypothetical protein